MLCAGRINLSLNGCLSVITNLYLAHALANLSFSPFDIPFGFALLPTCSSTSLLHLARNWPNSCMFSFVLRTSVFRSAACCALMYRYNVSWQEGELSELMQMRRHSASARRPIKSSWAERRSVMKVATRMPRSKRPTRVPGQSMLSKCCCGGCGRSVCVDDDWKARGMGHRISRSHSVIKKCLSKELNSS